MVTSCASKILQVSSKGQIYHFTDSIDNEGQTGGRFASDYFSSLRLIDKFHHKLSNYGSQYTMQPYNYTDVTHNKSCTYYSVTALSIV